MNNAGVTRLDIMDNGFEELWEYLDEVPASSEEISDELFLEMGEEIRKMFHVSLSRAFPKFEFSIWYDLVQPDSLYFTIITFFICDGETMTRDLISRPLFKRSKDIIEKAKGVNIIGVFGPYLESRGNVIPGNRADSLCYKMLQKYKTVEG